MSKEKLISLIIRKETYKDVKPYLVEILNLKEQAVRVSAQAIQQILNTNYNLEAKLYALRYLKDAFQQGNPSFIAIVETDLLPILAGIALDQNDEKAVYKYAASYPKKQQLDEFKSLLFAVFLMTKECLLKWSSWMADPNRKFVSTVEQLKKKNVRFELEQFKYFRPENEQIFKENCRKNGVKLVQGKPKSVVAQKLETKKESGFIGAIELSISRMAGVQRVEQIQEIENTFNNAIDGYLSGGEIFKEEDMQRWIQEFQKAKKEAGKRTRQTKANADNIKQSKVVEKQTDKSKIQTSNQINSKSSITTEIKPKLNTNQGAFSKQDNSTSKIKHKQETVVPLATPQPLPNSQAAQQPQQEQYFFKVSAPVDTSKVTRPKQPQKETPLVKRQQIKEIQKTNKEVSTVKSTSKRPLVFEDQPEIPDKKAKESIVKFETSEKWSKTNSERVVFSQQESEQSQQAVAVKVNADFYKKKADLSSIQQEKQQIENNRSKIKTSRSDKMFEEGETGRSRNGAVNNKLLQQNAVLIEKLQRVVKQLAVEKENSAKVVREMQEIQKQLVYRKQIEDKMTKKLKGSVPMQDYNRLRQDLEQEKDKFQALAKQHVRLRTDYEQKVEQLKELRLRFKNSQKDTSRQLSPDGPIESRVVIGREKGLTVIAKQQIDEDYVKDLTHPSQMHRWLNEVNTILFKKSVLNSSSIFYRDDYVAMSCACSVYTQNNSQFLSMKLSWQFRSLKQVSPQVRYRNSQQVQIWVKPLVGEELSYSQQVAIRLCRNPLRIIKGELKIIESVSVVFLMPFMYVSFLREEEFRGEEFDEIYETKSEMFIKSKIVQWNKAIVREVADFKLIFKSATVEENRLRFCLSQGINDQVFMVQVQVLRNSKLMLRVFPIPYSSEMVGKAKELVQDLIFLLS